MNVGSGSVNFLALGARLQQASSAGTSGASRTQTRIPLLLLLDLHGVLVQRVRIWKGNSSANRRAKLSRQPWKTIGKHYVWQRPYLRQFLDIATTRYSVGIWSAAEERSVSPIISELSSDLQLTPSLMRRLKYLCYRVHCRPDPHTSKYSVVKYLPDVWKSTPFSEDNTIIVDDTLEKVRHHPMSAVVVPEYTSSNFPRSFNHDDTLLWLLLYIEYLASSAESGNFLGSGIAQVRRFLMPFDEFCNLGHRHASNLVISDRQGQCSSSALAFFPQPSTLCREPSRARDGFTEAETEAEAVLAGLAQLHPKTSN